MQNQDHTVQATAPRVRRLDYEAPISSPSCPTCGRPFPEELPTDVQTAASPVAVPELPNDPSVRGHVHKVLTVALEVFDGRRTLAQLHKLVIPSALRYLSAAAETHRPNRVSRLRSLHICQPAEGVAEAAAVAMINGHPRALAVRFERDDAGTRVCAALRILL